MLVYIDWALLLKLKENESNGFAVYLWSCGSLGLSLNKGLRYVCLPGGLHLLWLSFGLKNPDYNHFSQNSCLVCASVYARSRGELIVFFKSLFASSFGISANDHSESLFWHKKGFFFTILNCYVRFKSISPYRVKKKEIVLHMYRETP